MMLTVSYGSINIFLLDNGSYNAAILDGTCHHVAVTRTGNTIEFFVDGMSIGATGFSGVVNSTATDNEYMAIGNCEYDPRPFDGNISEVRIWNYARSQADIQAHMNTSITLSPAGLVSNWRLHEGSGQVVTDPSLGTTGFLGDTDLIETTDALWSVDGCTYTVTGIEEQHRPESIVSYPNPTSDVLNFRLDNRRVTQIRVMDVAGRAVRNESFSNSSKVTLTVADLSQGSYVAVLFTNQGIVYSRFTKM